MTLLAYKRVHYKVLMTSRWTPVVTSSVRPHKCASSIPFKVKITCRRYSLLVVFFCIIAPINSVLSPIDWVNRFWDFNQVMRRPCWWSKQSQNVTQVLPNNRVKFPRLFGHCSFHQLKAGFHMIANDCRRSRIADDRGSKRPVSI